MQSLGSNTQNIYTFQDTKNIQLYQAEYSFKLLCKSYKYFYKKLRSKKNIKGKGSLVKF